MDQQVGSSSTERPAQLAPLTVRSTNVDGSIGIVHEFTKSRRRLAQSIAEFLVLTLLTGCVPLIVVADISILGNAIPEQSLTEYSQAALLMFSSVSLAISAWLYKDRRGFLVLLAALFGCMFIREQNALLDQFRDGLWFVAAMALAVAAIAVAWRSRETIASTVHDYVDTRSAVSLSTGLVLVLVFSRIFGTFHLWNSILPHEHSGMTKKVVQECLELLGYLFIAFGAYSYCPATVAVTMATGSAAEKPQSESDTTSRRRAA